MLKEEGSSATVDQYYELIDRGESVAAEEILAAGIVPLSCAANLKLFVDKYCMEHGRVYGEGPVSELMLETMSNMAESKSDLLCKLSKHIQIRAKRRARIVTGPILLRICSCAKVRGTECSARSTNL